jgi:hypothetical protein
MRQQHPQGCSLICGISLSKVRSRDATKQKQFVLIQARKGKVAEDRRKKEGSRVGKRESQGKALGGKAVDEL